MEFGSKNIASVAKAAVSGASRLFSRSINISAPHYCPVCEQKLTRFYPFGDPPRPHARCPNCRSLERHRLDWLFFKKKTDLFDMTPKSFLHIAPEPFFSKKFQELTYLDYLSADLEGRSAMEEMDITSIDKPSGSFSVIYCSHVLEHIQDDRQAIAELYRILSDRGWAVLQVLVTVEKTYEDPSITSPEEKKKHYGQEDHVRRCGPDYADRIRAAGFHVKIFRSLDVASSFELKRMGIQEGRWIFYCEK